MPSLEDVMGTPVRVVPDPVETPSGLRIAYQSDPRQYWVNDVPVPSVTEVLQILHKPSLLWWAQKIGVQGVAAAFYEPYRYENPITGEVTERPALVEVDGWWQKGPELLVDQLTARRITVNHVRDKAGDRGTSVHMALERWAETGDVPDPEKWPEEEQGYVRGLVAFLTSVDIHPLKSELMVGSARKGFAGRFDLLAHTESGTVNPTPRKKRVIPEGAGIWDLKTGKGIYPDSHYLQLSAYRFAMEESGYGRADYEAIVNVREDGSWDVGISDRQPTDFLAVKGAFDALRAYKK